MKFAQMNNASNASGTTHTTMTLLEDNGSSNGGSSLHSNGDDHGERLGRGDSNTPSLISQTSMRSLASSTAHLAPRSGVHLVFDYKIGNFVEFEYGSVSNSEEVCISFCRRLKILPTTRLLFCLRVYDVQNEWLPPRQALAQEVRYCFRMRFKVPMLDTQLHALDAHAYEYLYRQMRFDMLHETITEIRYPAKKDNVMGLGVVDMYIDLLEKRDTADHIESNYKRYLPRKLMKAHKVFVKPKICGSFRQFRSKTIDLNRLKWNYVHELHTLAPNYLLERHVATVDYIPDDEEFAVACGGTGNREERVYVELNLYDTAEPGMKVARHTNEDKWMLIAKLENIYALYIKGNTSVCFEITGFPNGGYRMQFASKVELEAFITYLAGYIRLTSKWMLDLCMEYMTPSLQELKNLRCHGPIGGAFSFAKIREKSDKCGSYIIRQCEKEYDTCYIDINTRSTNLQPEKCKTETFKIHRDRANSKWLLHYNDDVVPFDDLTNLAHYIPTESEQKFRLPPSEYDRPPLLLICLPKKLLSKKTETELSEAELQRKRVQIFDPKIDLQWYKNSQQCCDNGKMTKWRADWVQQQGSVKDVRVTLKVLEFDTDFAEFMKLANSWSKIYSPQFIKLYGLTLSTPYTLVMEHAPYGPLNEFLMRFKVSIKSLLDVVHGLVRGMVYLQEFDIVHGRIRCSNLYVTKFDTKSNLLEAKIGDPGFPRPYGKDELPFIPFEYHSNMNAAKEDRFAEFWAFATTVWQIFARGKPIVNHTSEIMYQNFNRYGGILPPIDDCPDDMYKTMMDGWSTEPDKRFNHQEIFQRLIACKEELDGNYASVSGANDTLSDTSSLSGITMDNLNGFKNGANYESCALSSNSTTCDQAPLICNQNSRNTEHLHHNQQFNPPWAVSKRSYRDDTPSVLQIENGKIIYKKKIGEGHYGTVYLGEMRYNSSKMESELVAIKSLKTLRPTQINNDFMREIDIMRNLDHPNIVKIKQWIDDPISIIMEYLECGSFIVYLSSRKPNLTDSKLLRFALDIAEGMDYLCTKKVIHRDLAARNILVDGERVKISDFGLAQMANKDGYYIAQSEREIPVKWYSPESIKTGKFSFQSDVWSYGVTLFEMFSRGETPNLDGNKEINNEEFLNRLDQGDRLSKPLLCPPAVYEKLMLPCWHKDPKMRPTFKVLIEIIQSIINENGESV